MFHPAGCFSSCLLPFYYWEKLGKGRESDGFSASDAECSNYLNLPNSRAELSSIHVVMMGGTSGDDGDADWNPCTRAAQIYVGPVLGGSTAAVAVHITGIIGAE